VWAGDIAQAHEALAAVEKRMQVAVTTEMWDEYSALRKLQHRVINAFRDGDRDLSKKLRPTAEKRLRELKARFQATRVGAMGRVAG